MIASTRTCLIALVATTITAMLGVSLANSYPNPTTAGEAAPLMSLEPSCGGCTVGYSPTPMSISQQRVRGDTPTSDREEDVIRQVLAKVKELEVLGRRIAEAPLGEWSKLLQTDSDWIITRSNQPDGEGGPAGKPKPCRNKVKICWSVGDPSWGYKLCLTICGKAASAEVAFTGFKDPVGAVRTIRAVFEQGQNIKDFERDLHGFTNSKFDLSLDYAPGTSGTTLVAVTASSGDMTITYTGPKNRQAIHSRIDDGAVETGQVPESDVANESSTLGFGFAAPQRQAPPPRGSTLRAWQAGRGGRDETVGSQWGGCNGAIFVSSETLTDPQLQRATAEINSITQALDPWLDQREGLRVRLINVKGQLLLAKVTLVPEEAKPDPDAITNGSTMEAVSAHFGLVLSSQMQIPSEWGPNMPRVRNDQQSGPEWLFDSGSSTFHAGWARRQTLYPPQLWVLSKDHPAHDHRLAQSTKRVNSILSQLRQSAPNKRFDLGVAQVGAQVMLVWVSKNQPPNPTVRDDDKEKAYRLLRLRMPDARK